MSYLASCPAPFALLCFPFSWVILCLVIFPVLVEVSCVEEGPWSVSPTKIMSLEPAQWECEAQITLCRTFGQLGGLCAVQLTSLHQLRFWMSKMGRSHCSLEDVLYVLSFCYSMVLCSGTHPDCLPFWWFLILTSFSADILLILGFYLNQYIKVVRTFYLPFCLMVGILPWAGLFLPDIVFFLT